MTVYIVIEIEPNKKKLDWERNLDHPPRIWIYVTDVWFLKWFGINVHLDKTAERIKVEWLGSNEWIPLDGSKSKIILLKSGSPHLQKVFQLLQIFWEIYNVERGTHNLKCLSSAVCGKSEYFGIFLLMGYVAVKYDKIRS